MLGIALDTVALWAICSLLARQNLSSEMFRFLICAGLLIAANVVVILAGAPLPVALILVLATLLCSLRLVIGMSWPGSFLGGGIFIAYKVLFTIAYAAMTKA